MRTQQALYEQAGAGSPVAEMGHVTVRVSLPPMNIFNGDKMVML